MTLNQDEVFQLDRPPLCEVSHLLIEPVFTSTSEAPAVVLGGTSGDYTATFTLGIPGKDVYREHIDIRAVFNAGESLIDVPTIDASGRRIEGVRMREISDDGTHTFDYLMNQEHQLARAVIHLHATSIRDAEAQAYRVVSRHLSILSAIYGVGVAINAQQTVEDSTGQVLIRVGLVGRSTQIDARANLNNTGTPEIEPLLATYREGLISASIFYRCLCFYKVGEGIRRVRAARTREAKDAGHTPSVPVERIPDRLEDISVPLWDREAFEPYLGQKFSRVFDALWQQARNGLAHLDPTEQDTLSLDDWGDVGRCQNLSIVLHFMCGVMLEHELSRVASAEQ